MKFCPTCRYYLYMKTTKGGDGKGTSSGQLLLTCNNCGYNEVNTKGGLIMETDLQEKTAEGYKILINEFTRSDQTLPSTDIIKCPNPDCGSNIGSDKRNIIYMKYDQVNLKFLYLCNVKGCEKQWRSKGT
jgi:DNA-directed RNA polymerase subunit M/transcription elongation factor TFIIS